MMWECFAGDAVCDLFRIQGTLNQHSFQSILQRIANPSGLHLVGLWDYLFFDRSMTPNTPPGYVRAI